MAHGSRLRLLLDGQDVGAVYVAHEDNAWRFGLFEPSPRFDRFAPVFSRWTELLHVPVELATAPEAAAWALRLRTAEQAVDRLRAELLFPGTGQRRRIFQVNIDPPLVEWLANDSPDARAADAAEQQGTES